ncbi:MAG: peptide chain release factor family protein [Phycisphaerales bacterium]
MHPASLELEALLAQCTIERGRSGGPGGQNRNKVETLIIITHDPTGIEAHAGERRSQRENRSVAVRRLRLALAVEVRALVDRARGRAMLAALDTGEGSPLWRERTRSGRIVCNPDHWDFPALLAEALDHAADCEGDLARAAERLGVSTSQMLKLLREHPPALAGLNAQRVRHGLRPLR